jgi:hypothetical protein
VSVDEWREFKKHMNSPPFLVSTLVNGTCFAKTLVDCGCLAYGIIDSHFVTKHNLKCMPIEPRSITSFKGVSTSYITEVAWMSIDINGHREEKVFFYVVLKLASYDLLLGMSWLTKQDVRLHASKSEILVGSSRTIIRNYAKQPEDDIDCLAVSAVVFNRLSHGKRHSKMEVFAASLADINKALRARTKADPRTKLLAQFHEFLDVFSQEQADRLPPARGKGVDHEI